MPIGHTVSLLAYRLLEQAANARVSWLAAPVLIVVSASVDWASRVWIIDAILKDLSYSTIRACNRDVTKTNWDIATLNSGVAQVADHPAGETDVIVAFVGDARLVTTHRGKHKNCKGYEHPDHRVQDVYVSDDTVAKL